MGRSLEDILVEFAGEEQVRRLRPDFDKILRLPARGLIITSRSSRTGLDFVSRFFAPAVGVPEDPVTGSAHCVLAPFWAARLGKTRMTASQLSKRGGLLRVGLEGSRVKIAGRAVTVFRAVLL